MYYNERLDPGGGPIPRRDFLYIGRLPDALGCSGGAVRIERELVLKPGDNLHLAAWQRKVAGATSLSIVVETATKGARRPHQRG